MSKAFVATSRVFLVSSAVAFAFCVLLTRLVYLHVWQQQELKEYAEGNRKFSRPIEARRGNVVDTRGNLLATTNTTIDLGVDPQTFRESDLAKLPALAELIDVPVEELERIVTTKTRKGDTLLKEVKLIQWAFLAKGLNIEDYEKVMALKIKGVYGTRKYSRTYPGGKLAAHVLGYINHEETPVLGVERYFDYYLRGQDGWRESERDGRSRELVQFREREVPATDGLNVELTIDQMIQHITEKEIERIAETFDPKGVSIIVSEPATGGILAMANYPTYDPNEFYNTKKYPVAWQRNRALTDLYEPGSTFKIVPAAAAINEGLVSPDDVFQTDVSRVQHNGYMVSLPADHHDYPSLSVHDIVVKSSNRGAAHLGLLLGKNRLYDYTKNFGFGATTGCDLDGEAKGTLHKVSAWDRLTITRLPMGHAINATAMQVHSATSVIANNGILMEPMLTKRVFDMDGETVVRFSPKAKHRVVSTETAKIVSQMLVDVVGEDGTARKASIKDYAVAGKTGTTQKIVDGKYSRNHHVASFTGYFPADNPALVITVVVDEPQLRGVGYGGSVAAPAFRNIAEGCIAYLGIRPSKTDPSFLALENISYDRSSRISN